ncbi:MAG: hypothetical protein L6R41_000767 [Letrouitia leprolyta]|nr:MAG: hypothetical protein L6R41_000767 [Letrouitia leprolyta]
MSNYINSFLIEPAIRQARRFSRPSNDDHAADRQLSSGGPDEINHGGGDPRVMGVWERSWRLRAPPTAASSTAESENLPPDSEAASWTWRDHRQHSAPLQRTGIPLDEDSALSVRSDIISFDHRVSSNPVYGRVPESLGSTTSSLSSAQATMDPVPRMIQDSARTTRQNSQGDETHQNEKRSRRLPADDGMGSMRKRIAAIQRTDSSSSEKARMIHDLMTEQYNSSQSSLHASNSFRARSPASLGSHERPITPASLRSMDNSVQCTSPPTSLSSVADTSNPFNLSFEDLKPTFYEKLPSNQPTAVTGTRSTDQVSDASEDDSKPLGCRHYRRNIKLQCSACYRCRSIINMEMQFRHLERAIESQPMPPEFQDTKAWVYCNDCNTKSLVKYHWLGMKCGVCDSYNTAQLQMIRGPDRGNFPEQTVPSARTRGRPSDTTSPTQRTTSSAPPSVAVPPAEEPYEPSRTLHSQEPHPMAHLSLSPDTMDAYSDDEDEEYSDDVDFWGLGSTSPRSQTVLRGSIPSSSSSEDEDESDDDMSDDPTDEEEEDQMEIFGHR